MTDEQKEDLQFWFYTKVFADRAAPAQALASAASELGLGTPAAFDYLRADGRLSGSPENPEVKTFENDEADPTGVYVDIEWMLHILHRNGLRGQALWNALGSIYKIPPSLARQEAEQIPIDEGED